MTVRFLLSLVLGASLVPAFPVAAAGQLSAPVAAAGQFSAPLPAAGQLSAPVAAAAPPAQVSGLECADPPGGHAAAGLPTADLTCFTLYASPAAAGAGGVVRLLPAPTPFGIAVDRDGVLRHRFVVVADGLPPPESLGAYTRYVAWITPPSLTPMVRLGEVANGRSELGVGGFNSYLFLVSAEGPDPVDERTGPLVLRGTSPTMVLRPHDLPYLLVEMSARLPDEGAHGAHRDPDAGVAGGHDGHDPGNPHGATPTRAARDSSGTGAVVAAPPRATRAAQAAHRTRASHDAHDTPVRALPPPLEAWRPPPMHPEVDMPAQMMMLRPEVAPFLPFPDSSGIPDAIPRERVMLADGDTLTLEAGPIFRRIGGLRVPGYGFNGQSPGPLIEADEGSTIHIRFLNRTPLPSAIHWHGIRLDARFDGVPGITQDPVASGADFDYRLRLPDEGTFWYHPHLREDVMQDMGLAGNLRVIPTREDDGGRVRARYAPVDREEFLVLDDHLVGPEGPVPYGREAPVHAFMGRVGNVLLVNGVESWQAEARPGEVVRFHLTNVASSRTFNVSFGGLPLKLVASDVGKLPREVFVESVVIAPAERWVVDVRFTEGGEIALENRVQALDHMAARFFPEVDALGSIRIRGSALPASRAAEGERIENAFRELRDDDAIAQEVARLVEEHADARPDRTLRLDVRTEGLPFPLDPLVLWEGIYRPPVEWSGTMPDMDWLATGVNVQWLLVDAETGAENMDIDWRFRQGDRMKLRMINDRSALHAMQHPIHLHGQRFLVLSVDGEAVAHPSWKDTVLVPVGAVVDILVEMENPGPWMLHCHIAEHLETGMMTIIRVEP